MNRLRSNYVCIILAFTLALTVLDAAAPSFEDYPVYQGSDLGVNYSPDQTTFKVWAPRASEVVLRLYSAGRGGEVVATQNLLSATQGVWTATITRDLKDQYYTFQVKQDDRWLLERPDVYAKAVGVNGRRGMIVNLSATNPKGWVADKKPILKNFTDIILYETHVRDISINSNSGIQHKGKFLGVVEPGTKSKSGEATGLDHLKELGITHLHLLPSFDFNSVDETTLSLNKYNWGYDPLNYNVPEGSFATDPFDGKVRIAEFKQMVKTLHENGIRVILDVVYNHTSGRESNFNQFAPGYFYRFKADGSYSNGTGCGNETASERAMMRKFIIDSVVYWANEYHLDGFRFDLMGVHDIETMNQVSDTLHKIDPSIFVYGEGWTGGQSPFPEDQRAVKKNTARLHGIAAFSDDVRDGLRGYLGNTKTPGFVSGNPKLADSVKFGIVASTQHPQINYNLVNHSKAPWAAEPFQTITYASCHDDHTLFDHLKLVNPDASEAEIIKMDKLAAAAVLTSQGVAFLHSGSEMLRTKQGNGNSYNSPDSINQIDWDRKTTYNSVYTYYKGMVGLRKNHPAFRMPSTKLIQEHLRFLETENASLIAYQISGAPNGESWQNIIVLLNGSKTQQSIKLPPGNWTLVADGNEIKEQGIQSFNGPDVTIPGTTAYILFKSK
ncbi:MAG: pulA [Verrucomicrobiales bacterium]|nr:pulA [Verrucomicrobiales bacterium]